MNLPADEKPGGTTAERWWTKPAVRSVALFIYYLGILIALLFLYGRGEFKTAPFVYQGF